MRLLLAILVALAAGRTAAQPTNAAAVRFQAVDIWVDSQDKPLAAYQIEFSVTGTDTKIVGIEGGESSAFSQPPYYDPQAMQHERAIIAAFSTNAVTNLPKGKTRVATIHLQISGAEHPEFILKLQASADASGNKISAEAGIEERKAD
jgi:hypothetical protein